MPVRYWMITNRNQTNPGKSNNELGKDEADLTFWVCDLNGVGDLPSRLSQWRKRERADFSKDLAKVTLRFPVIPESEHENEKHVTFFVHGFNNSAKDALRRYQQLCQTMFQPDRGLGVCVLFSWPSDGLRLDITQTGRMLAVPLTSLEQSSAICSTTKSRLRQKR